MGTTAKRLYTGKPPIFIANPTVAPVLTLANYSLPIGTYYVAYTWVDAGGETMVSPESTITIAEGKDIQITVPTFPSGVTGINYYIGVATGVYTKQGSSAAITVQHTAAIVAGNAKPVTNTSFTGNPTTAPTLLEVASIKLTPNTYYAAYSYSNQYGETILSPVVSLATTNGKKIVVTMPTLPVGVATVKVYGGMTASALYLQGSTATNVFDFTNLPVSVTLPKLHSNIAQILYTVPVSKTTIVKDIVFTNTSLKAAYISLFLIPNTNEFELTNQIVYNYEVAAGDTVVMGMSAVIETGDRIEAYQLNNNGTTVYISGVEVQ